MNRAQRRLQAVQQRKTELTDKERQLNERLHNYYQKQLNELVDKYNKELEEMEEELQHERENNVTNDWYWFYANLCLTLKDDYHKNNDYIAKFVDKMENRLRGFKNTDMSRDELIAMCSDKCGIILCDEEDEHCEQDNK